MENDATCSGTIAIVLRLHKGFEHRIEASPMGEWLSLVLQQFAMETHHVQEVKHLQMDPFP